MAKLVGSGKSTTMRLILGLDNPSAGNVTVHGKSYRDLPAPMREVGAVLDPKAIYGKRTAERHLSWIAQAGGIPQTRVGEVLDIVGLSNVAGRNVGNFSLGMSQRLGIATALLGDPPVLLFDEPVGLPLPSATGAPPGVLAVGDLDGDGLPDLAVPDQDMGINVFFNQRSSGQAP